MEKLTKLNGIGEYELRACFECGDGGGPDNENCGNCQKSLDAHQRLGEYESTGLEPDEIPHWIPVSERIPEESQNCLCYFNDGSMAIYWSNGKPYKFHPDVTHWMPLPQPPKEDGI